MSDPLSPHGPRKGKVVNIRIKFLDDTVHVFQVAVSPILFQLRTRAQPPLLNICSPFSKNINFFLYFIFQPQPPINICLLPLWKIYFPGFSHYFQVDRYRVIHVDSIRMGMYVYAGQLINTLVIPLSLMIFILCALSVVFL